MATKNASEQYRARTRATIEPAQEQYSGDRERTTGVEWQQRTDNRSKVATKRYLKEVVPHLKENWSSKDSVFAARKRDEGRKIS